MFEDHLKGSFSRKQKIKPDNWLKKIYYLVFQQSGVGFEKVYAKERTPLGTYCVSFEQYKRMQWRARIFSILTLFFVSISILLISVYFPPGGYYRGAAASIVVCPEVVNDCDYTTIADGIAAAGEGDVVDVRAGTYSENLSTLDSKTNLTIQGAGWDQTFIVGSTDVHVLACNNCDNLVIEDLNISGVSAETLKFGIAVTNSDNVTIRNNKINGQTTGYGGIAVANVDGTIKNNIVYDTTTIGMMTQTIGGGSNDAFVHNNVIYNSGAVGVISTGSGIKARVVNNIIAGTITNALQVTDSGEIYSYYNDIYGVTNAYVNVTDNANDLTSDPLFIDEANDNFYLKPDSPCINAGDPTRTLPSGYTPGNQAANLSLVVNDLTNILTGDTIFVTTGVTTESDTVDSVDSNTSTITLTTGFTNSYVANTAYVYTATSDYSSEQSPSGSQVNIGVNGGLVYASTGENQSAIFVDDTNGDDRYNGTSATFTAGATGAKKTIQAGVENLASGGTLTVAAGEYTENVTVSTSNVILTGAGAATTSISASDSGNALTLTGAGATISGFTFKEAERGISLESSNNTISDCIISDNTSTSATWDYRAFMAPLVNNGNTYNSIAQVGGPRGITYFLGGSNTTNVSRDNTIVSGLDGSDHLNLALVSVGSVRPAVFLPDSVAADAATALPIFQGWWGDAGTVAIDYWQSSVWQNSTPGEAGGAYTWQADSALTVPSAAHEASFTPLAYENVNYSDGVYYLVTESLISVYSQSTVITGLTEDVGIYAAVGTDESGNKITAFTTADWGTNCQEVEEQVLAELGDVFNCVYFAPNTVWRFQDNNQDYTWFGDNNLSVANDAAYLGPTLTYNSYSTSLTGSLASDNYGIYFDASNNNTLEDNTFTNNGTSIFFEDSTGNSIIGGSIEANSYEIKSELAEAGINNIKNVDFDYTNVSVDAESDLYVYYKASVEVTAEDNNNVSGATITINDNTNNSAATLTTDSNGDTELSDYILAYQLGFAGIHDSKNVFSVSAQHPSYLTGLESFILDTPSEIITILLNLLPRYAPSCTISVSPSTINLGESAVLEWSTRKAEEVSLEVHSELGLEDLGVQEITGQLDVSPPVSTTYILRVQGRDLESVCRTELTVNLPPDPPTCTLIAEPQEIKAGDPVTLFWQTSHAISGYFTPEIIIEDFDITHGSVDVYPKETTNYIFTAEKGAQTAVCEAEVLVELPPPSCTLSFNKETVIEGTTAVLSWAVKHAQTGFLEPELEDWDFVSGEIEIIPEEDTTYTLTVERDELIGTCQATILLAEKLPLCTLAIDPASVIIGTPATLRWETANTRSASLRASVEETALLDQASLPTGTLKVSPEETTTYTMDLVNVEKINTCETAIEVQIPDYEVPSCELSISPEVILPGQAYTLTWQTTNTKLAVLDQDIGEVAATGGSLKFVAINPLAYTLEVAGKYLSATCSVPLEITIPDDKEEELEKEDEDEEEKEEEEPLLLRRILIYEQEEGEEIEEAEVDETVEEVILQDLLVVNYLNDKRPVIKGAAFAGWPAEIYLNGQRIATVWPDEEGLFVYQPLEDLPDGKYSAEIKVGLLKTAWEFVIDTVPPKKPTRVSSKITALKALPAEDLEEEASVALLTEILFKGKLGKEEFEELDYLVLNVESEPYQEIFKPESLDWERKVSLALDLGNHQSYVVAKDRAGNFSPASEPQTFIINFPACNDEKDNDGDGLIDYPEDPGCLDSSDGSESDLQQTLASAVGKVGETTKAIVKPVQTAISVSTQAVKNVSQAINETAVVIEFREEVLDNPIIEEANEEYLAPAMVTVAGANVATGLGWFGFAAYLRYLMVFFTEPLYFFIRRKKRAWGIVYNSFNRKPLALAVVRVFDAVSKKLIGTSVADLQGRYRFILQPGRYYLEATKPGFVYSNQFSQSKISTLSQSHIYQGGEFIIKPGEELVELNIPLKPSAKDKPNKSILLHHWLKKFQGSVAFIGPVFGVISFAISPSSILLALLVIHFLLYVLFKKVLKPRRDKRVGKIYDLQNRQPIKRAIVRIYESGFNKLLDTQITDSNGHYNFLVGRGAYFMTVEQDNYLPYKSQPVNTFERKEEDLIIADNIGMSQKNMV